MPSPVELKIRNVLNSKNVARIINELNDVKSRARTYYGTPKSYDGPEVSEKYVVQHVGALPLIPRGGNPTPVSSYNGQMRTFAPLAVKPSDAITGELVHDMNKWGDISFEQWAKDTIEYLRKSTVATAEALSAQALSGTTNYPVLLDNGKWDSFYIPWGNPWNVVPDKKWDASDADPSDVYKTLSAMKQKLKSLGNNIAIWAAPDVAGVLIKMAKTVTNMTAFTMQSSESGMLVNGFRIEDVSDVWENPQTGAEVPYVPAKTVMMLALGGSQAFAYCASDDLIFGLQSSEFLVRTIFDQKTGSGSVIAETKQLPLPYVKGIVTATVLT